FGLSRALGWSLIREARFEDHDGVAASDRVVDRRRGFGEAGFDNPLANGAGEPRRAGADAVGLPGRPLVLCGWSCFGGASSDGLGLSGLSQGEGPGLSARVVDDAALGSPRARAWTRRRTRLPRQAGSGHGVQDPQ